ncbi:MAG: glycosyltransferase family 4 protein [Acidimicrobiales bacterium]
MKILHLTDLFAPCIGGMESHVLYLARERTRRGHDVSVVTLVRPGGVATNRMEDIGFRVYRISGTYTRFRRAWASPDKPYHPPFPDPLVARQLQRILDEEQPDVVQAHNWIAYSYLAIKTPSSPPLLWTQHDYSLACPKKTLMYHRDDGTCPGPALRRCVPCSDEQYGAVKGTALTLGLFASNAALHRRIDGIVAVSTAVARAVRLALGRTDVPVTVVNGFVEDDATVAAGATPRPKFLPKQDGYLLFVGALGIHKGITDLLEAFELLGDDVPPLVVLGTPRPDTPTRWPRGVIVRENVPHDQVMAAWRHCGIGVVPSRWAEPFGLVPLEAASAGCPVVATRTGGLVESVEDGISGLLVPPQDPSAMATAIRHLLDNPTAALEMGLAGQRRAEQFTVSKTTTILDAILEELIERRRV